MCEIMTEIDFRMVFDFLREICLGYQIEYKTLESQKFFTPVLVFYPLPFLILEHAVFKIIPN